MAFIFVVMVYSGSSPILIPIMGIYLIFRYWTDKYQLLRYCSKPPRFDSNIHDKIMLILPFSLFFHFGFSFWFYGQNEIFKQGQENEDAVEN